VPIISDGTLGLHYRGTDRAALGVSTWISPAEFVVVLRDFLVRNTFSTFYVASDVQEFVDLIAHNFSHKRIITFNQWRASEHSVSGIHFTKVENVSTESMAKAAFTDLLALSQCSVILKTSSSFSAFAKVLNPAVKLLTITANGMRPFFPEGVSSSYYSDSVTSKHAARILQRTLRRPDKYETRSSRQVLSSLCSSSTCYSLRKTTDFSTAPVALGRVRRRLLPS